MFKAGASTPTKIGDETFSYVFLEPEDQGCSLDHIVKHGMTPHLPGRTQNGHRI